MAFDSRYKHHIIFWAQFRFCYLNTFISIAFYPNLRQRVLMPKTFPEYMNMPSVIVHISWYRNQNKHF